MIAVFVRNKNATQIFWVQLKSPHAHVGFPTGKTCIDQHRIMRIADIVAVSITS
jgi:hypothetical protein